MAYEKLADVKWAIEKTLFYTIDWHDIIKI